MSAASTSVQLNTSAGMQYVRLGKSGLKVSRISLGTMLYGSPEWREWVLDPAASRPFIVRALERGINFFDTANVYSAGDSERILGQTLKELGTRRSDLVIATKVFAAVEMKSTAPRKPNQHGLSRKHIFEALDASLERLQMDYVDLYQIHRLDYEVEPEEIMCALNDLVRSGKVRYIGASSMPAWQFQRLQNVAEKNGWTKFISMQNHYNLVYREEEREMNPFCEFSGVGLIPWSPLARGFLTGKRDLKAIQSTKADASLRSKTDDLTDAFYNVPSNQAVVDAVIALAEKKGVKPAQIALAWLLHKSAVSAPIIGASKMYQLDEAADAVSIVLTKEEVASLETPYASRPQMAM